MHPLHKLHVYGQAQALAALCRTHCMHLEDRDLRWQLMRAVRSIAANLAEGAGSETQATFARYIAIALASAKETECHLAFARESKLLSQAQYQELLGALNRLTPRLVALLASVRQNAKRRTRETP